MWLESGPMRFFTKSKNTLCVYQKQLKKAGYDFVHQYFQKEVPLYLMAFVMGRARKTLVKLVQESCLLLWILSMS